MKPNFTQSQLSTKPTPQKYPCIAATPGSSRSFPQSPKKPAGTQQPQVPGCHPKPHPTSLTRPASVPVSTSERSPRHKRRYAGS